MHCSGSTDMGSPSAYEQICADLELEPGRFELTLRKEILRILEITLCVNVIGA
jgi:hypothetical protein